MYIIIYGTTRRFNFWYGRSKADAISLNLSSQPSILFHPYRHQHSSRMPVDAHKILSFVYKIEQSTLRSDNKEVVHTYFFLIDTRGREFSCKVRTINLSLGHGFFCTYDKIVYKKVYELHNQTADFYANSYFREIGLRQKIILLAMYCREYYTFNISYIFLWISALSNFL